MLRESGSGRAGSSKYRVVLSVFAACAAWLLALPGAAFATDADPWAATDLIAAGNHEYAVASLAERERISEDAARANLALQARGAGIVEALQGRLGDGYAGVWFDQQAGRFKVGVAAGTNEDAVVATLSETGIAADSSQVAVGSSWRELEDGVRRWADRVAGLLDQQKAIVGIDPSSNAVVVNLATHGLSQSLLDELRSAAGQDDVRVVLAKKDIAAFEYEADQCDTNQRFCTKPLRGGVRIDGPGRACTAGFVALSNSDHKPYLLTAGHCLQGQVGQTWWTYNHLAARRNLGRCTTRSTTCAATPESSDSPIHTSPPSAATRQ